MLQSEVKQREIAMGYTTEFKGTFKLDKPMTVEHASIFVKYGRDEWPNPPGNSCNQWCLTSGWDGIEWDQEEKFYDWKAWLQYLIDNFLIPWGYTLSGSVEWTGGSRDDVGVLVVQNGRAFCWPRQEKPFMEHPEHVREQVIDRLYDAEREAKRGSEEAAAWRSLFVTLGIVRKNSRVEFDR